MTHHRERRPLSRPTQAVSPGVYTAQSGWDRGHCQGQPGELGDSQAFLFIVAFGGIHSPGLRLAACGRARLDRCAGEWETRVSMLPLCGEHVLTPGP